ncbi:MAG: hypothetical protein RLZZ204_844, partial [Bacteroidota bacterium]
MAFNCKVLKSNILSIVILLLSNQFLFAQNSFTDYQKTFSRVSKAFVNREETLKKEFE